MALSHLPVGKRLHSTALLTQQINLLYVNNTSSESSASFPKRIKMQGTIRRCLVKLCVHLHVYLLCSRGMPEDKGAQHLHFPLLYVHSLKQIASFYCSV